MKFFYKQVPTMQINIVGTPKGKTRKKVLIENCSSIPEALNLITFLTLKGCENCKIKRTNL